MVELQGGDVGVLENFATVHQAGFISEIKADRSGRVSKMDAETVGRASLTLGAGRTKADDTIDFTVGFDEIIKTGVEVQAGDVLARIHASCQTSSEQGIEAFLSGVEIL